MIDSPRAGHARRATTSVACDPTCRWSASLAEAMASEPSALAIGVAPAGGKLPAGLEGRHARGARARPARRERPARLARRRPRAARRRPPPPASSCATCARVPAGPRRPTGDGPRASPRASCTTVGTDCAIGKMTVCLELDREARRRGVRQRLRAHRADRHLDRRLGHRGRRGDLRLRRRRLGAAGARGRRAGRRACSGSRARARSGTRPTPASRSGLLHGSAPHVLRARARARPRL